MSYAITRFSIDLCVPNYIKLWLLNIIVLNICSIITLLRLLVMKWSVLLRLTAIIVYAMATIQTYHEVIKPSRASTTNKLMMYNHETIVTSMSMCHCQWYMLIKQRYIVTDIWHDQKDNNVTQHFVSYCLKRWLPWQKVITNIGCHLRLSNTVWDKWWRWTVTLSEALYCITIHYMFIWVDSLS